MKKVFLAAPFKSLVNSKTMSMDEEKKNEIVNLIEFLEKKGYSVHNAHKREAWGQEFMSPEQCTKIDYDEIEKCDILLLFQEYQHHQVLILRSAGHLHLTKK